MRKQLFASISTKVAIGVGAVALAAGTAGAAVVMQPVGDHHVDVAAVDHESTTTTTAAPTTAAPTTTTTKAPTTTTAKPAVKAEDDAKECDDESGEDDAAEHAKDSTDVKDSDDDATEHPANFGARVSADAKDCGVDGSTISQEAHDKNDAREAGTTATTDDSHRGRSGDNESHSGSGRDGGRDN